MSAILEMSEENLSNEHNVINMNDDILLEEDETVENLSYDENLSKEVEVNTSDEVLENDVLEERVVVDNKVEDKVVVDNSVNYTTDELITAYSTYLKAISTLPIGILDELNKSYLIFSDVFKSIPFNLLEILKKGFNNKSSNDIYFDEYMEKLDVNLVDLFNFLQVFYDFSTALSVNTISKVLYSYNYYKETFLKVPRESLKAVAAAYKDFKKIENGFSKDVLLSLNMVVPANAFLDVYKVSDYVPKKEFKEEKKFVLDNLEDISSSKEYGVSNDVKIHDDFTIVVPYLDRDDFTKLIMTEDGDSISPDELCSNNGRIIFDSCVRVKNNLTKEIDDIYKIKGYMSNSLAERQVTTSSIASLNDYLSLQVNARTNLIKKIEKDLVNGWNKINGDIGATLDPTWSNTDAYGVYEAAIKCAYSYKDEFTSIASFDKLLDEVNSYGFDIIKDYFK